MVGNLHRLLMTFLALSGLVAHDARSEQTQVLIEATPAPSHQGGTVTLSAKVTGDQTAPTGFVTFKDGATQLGRVALQSQVVVHAAGGGEHTCAALSTGTVACWGSNQHGQLGLGAGAAASVPTAVPGLSSVTQLAAGSGHTCARHADSTVSCWGLNNSGQLGLGTTNTERRPVKLTGLANVTSITAGASHTCARRSDGTAYCWGANGSGALGLGHRSSRSTPQVVPGLSGVTSLSAGGGHSCALTDAKRIWCWGRNSSGQLGIGSKVDQLRAVQVGLTNVSEIGTGENHTCALASNGRASCWGNGNAGQVGRPWSGVEDRFVLPQLVRQISGVRSIGIGASRSCAVVSDENVFCWGRDGTDRETKFNAVYEPRQVTGLSNTKAVFSSSGPQHPIFDAHSCALRLDGTLWCWGDNSVGQLGTGGEIKRNIPYALTNVFTAKSVGGGEHHSCILTRAGTVECAGQNRFGQLGIGGSPIWQEGNDRSDMTQLPGLSGVVSLSLGNYHACAAKGSGNLACWGHGKYGQLGLGSRSNSSIASDVPGLADVVGVGAGRKHTCAVHANSRVSCWGENSDGQLGLGDQARRRPSPYLVPDITDVSAVALGDAHTCALHRNASVSCWGSNKNGQLGLGDLTLRSSPVRIPGLGGVTEIDAGANFTCVRRSIGRVLCWGANANGQLGIGNASQQTTPQSVPGLADATVVVAGNAHACALKADSTVACWGSNSNGQLGVGDGNPRLVPTVIPEHSGMVSLAAGFQHTCAVFSNGTAACWGGNSSGELGSPSAGSFGRLSSERSPIPRPAIAATAKLDTRQLPTGSRTVRGYYGGAGALDKSVSSPLRIWVSP